MPPASLGLDCASAGVLSIRMKLVARAWTEYAVLVRNGRVVWLTKHEPLRCPSSAPAAASFSEHITRTGGATELDNLGGNMLFVPKRFQTVSYRILDARNRCLLPTATIPMLWLIIQLQLMPEIL